VGGKKVNERDESKGIWLMGFILHEMEQRNLFQLL
jgi:hypothetical protein